MTEISEKVSPPLPAINIFVEKGMPSETEKYVRTAYSETRSCLEEWFPPEAVPRAPTQLNIFRETTEEAEYVCQLRGKHHINIHLDPESIDNPFNQVNLYARIAHELIHQRTIETVGNEAVNGFDLDKEITDQEIQATTPKKLRSLVADKVEKAQAEIPEENRFLLLSVIEGMATLGELYFLNRLVEKSQKNQVEDIESAAREVKRGTLRGLRLESPYDPQTKEVKKGPYAFGTATLMRKLYRRFGIENIVDILRSIDLKGCAQIKKGSSSFDRIAQDPRLLPGLKNHPLVAQSLGNR